MEQEQNQEKIIWSHSKLTCILENPVDYYIKYKLGIKLKNTPTALSIGSAVHYGLEMNTADLQEYFNEQGNFKQKDNYSDEQCLAECMVDAFLRVKDKCFNEILYDENSNQILQLLDESHELKLYVDIPSLAMKNFVHTFMGIIDLLLLTEKGWILIDYKTSSSDVDWDQYKSQLIKYIILLKLTFPDTPVYKIAIINLKKSRIRRKKAENDIQFKNRIKIEYECNDDNLICWHIYNNYEFDKDDINSYLNNLIRQMDLGYFIDQSQNFCINYNALMTKYGKADCYDIIYNTQDNYLLYSIQDKIWNDMTNDFDTVRDCIDLDMKFLKNSKILNKYNIYKEERNLFSKNKSSYNINEFNEYLNNNYETNSDLLNLYSETYKHDN